MHPVYRAQCIAPNAALWMTCARCRKVATASAPFAAAVASGKMLSMEKRMSEENFQQLVIERLGKIADQLESVQQELATVRAGQQVLGKGVENVVADQPELHAEIGMLREEIAEVKEELRPAH